jgi:hypothetical protein
MFRSLCIIAALAVTFVSSAANAVIVRVGGAGNNYGHAFDQNSGIGAYLDNPTYAAQFGHTFTRSDTRTGDLASYLGTIDIYWSGLPFGSPISAADRDAFVTFIDNGGVVIANNDRSTLAPFTELFPLYAAYGVTPPNNQLTSGITSVANSAHPIISGPFGNVISFSLSDAGRFTASGDAFTTLMRWENGDIAAGLVDTAPGRKGALILLPDVEATGVSFNCCSNPSSAANNLGLNAWAYAAQVAFAADNPAEVSEPSMLALFGLSAAAFAVAARRRRKAAPDAVVAG